MATSMGAWVGNHRSRSHDLITTVCLPVILPSGLWALKASSNTSVWRIHGTMPRTYAYEDVTFVVTWTVPTGVTGDLNLGFHFRRYADGWNPSVGLEESAQFGTGVTAAPAAYVPKQRSVTVTRAALEPLTSGIGGPEPGEDYYVDITRTGGTTLTGDAYIIATEAYF